MEPTILGTEDAFVPDPEDWPTADHSGRSPEATENEADDLASSLPAGTGIQIEADEADVADQRQVLDLDEDDELRTD